MDLNRYTSSNSIDVSAWRQLQQNVLLARSPAVQFVTGPGTNLFRFWNRIILRNLVETVNCSQEIIFLKRSINHISNDVYGRSVESGHKFQAHKNSNIKFITNNRSL